MKNVDMNTSAVDNADAKPAMDIHAFVVRHGITMDSKPVSLSPTWEGDKDAQSWECTLKCGKRSYVTTFTKGGGHRTWSVQQWPYAKTSGEYSGYKRPKGWAKGQPARSPWNPSSYDKRAFIAWTIPTPPTAEEVLDCLAMESSAMDQSFEDWASDFGYDTDSRKAERAYNACRESGFALRKLLGYADFAILVNDVERM